MAQDHRVQAQRWELKYLVEESITPWVRDFCSAHLELDDYGIGRPNLSYPVHTLYLDSDDLRTYQYSINGTKNRFKLRLRYYDDKPNTPIFFEIKAREDNCILKQRCPVRRAAVPLMVAGQLPGPGQLLSKEARHQVTAEKFNLYLHQLRARPKVHNCYLREAWVSPNENSLRVTMDRKVMIEPYFKADAPVKMENPTPVFDGLVILELKFTNRFPTWFAELAREFNLMQFSASKYCEGIINIGESKFHDDYKAHDWEGWSPRVQEGLQKTPRQIAEQKPRAMPLDEEHSNPVRRTDGILAKK
jgi:hypothetical protein